MFADRVNGMHKRVLVKKISEIDFGINSPFSGHPLLCVMLWLIPDQFFPVGAYETNYANGNPEYFDDE